MRTRRTVAAVVASIFVVMFAGGGGSSRGIKEAGEKVTVAINHSPVALAVHAANNPETEHLVTDVFDAHPRDVACGRRVGAIWASPDCRDFSIAKGGKPRSKKIRSLAWSVIRWAKEVAPDRIFLENVREFEGWGPLLADGKRDPKRIGKTFRAWVAKLRKYGYAVEWRILNAADYGAPTSRRRLFLVARRDGMPITWPAPTHGKGPGLLPYKTAADCIDWSIPGTSIFDRICARTGRKLPPLKPKTLWRIAQGLKRFVFDNPRPFILKVNHGKWEPRHEDIDEPLSTVTAGRRGHAIVTPVLQQSGYGERKGQAARVLDIQQPIGTLVNGQKHALVQAFLVKHFGDPLRTDGGGGVVVGQSLDQPLGTITTRDHHSLAAITLATFRGTDPGQSGSADVEEPLPTVSTGGGRGGVHVAEVRAFLSAYYSNDATGGQQLELPLRTVTTKARLGIVMVHGTAYQIVDITFRMLEPHELLRGQCGEYADDYDLSEAKTKAAKVELIGNMVCPHPAKALVQANPAAPEAMAA